MMSEVQTNNDFQSMMRFIAVSFLVAAAISLFLAPRVLRNLSAMVTPDPTRAYVADATVVNLSYEPPERGLFSSRDGYWKAEVSVNGEPFTIAFPEKPALSVWQTIPLKLIPCQDSKHICEVGMIN